MNKNRLDEIKNRVTEDINKEDGEWLIEQLESVVLENIYKNEGMAIYIKGKMVIGIHSDNLENNLKALANGDMGFDWYVIAKNNGIDIS